MTMDKPLEPIGVEIHLENRLAMPLFDLGSADVGARVRDIEESAANFLAVGAVVLAHPDLVDRVRAGAPLNEPGRGAFYGEDERGHTDYPTLPAAVIAGGRNG